MGCQEPGADPESRVQRQQGDAGKTAERAAGGPCEARLPMLSLPRTTARPYRGWSAYC